MLAVHNDSRSDPSPEPRDQCAAQQNRIALHDTEAHVWRIPLDRQTAAFASRHLHEDERTRAARFRQPMDRLRFAATRGALRHLLGLYLGVAPETISLHFDAYGKPHLSAPGAIAFNVSHSAELAVIAIAAGSDVGVDVEHVRAVTQRDALAARYFAPSEAVALASICADGRDAAFLSLWTRKEAVAKASGEGLGLDFPSFAVPFPQAEGLAIVHAPAGRTIHWHVRTIDAGEEYRAALALSRPPRRIASGQGVPLDADDARARLMDVVLRADAS